jgi:hypothetical protein
VRAHLEQTEEGDLVEERGDLIDERKGNLVAKRERAECKPYINNRRGRVAGCTIPTRRGRAGPYNNNYTCRVARVVQVELQRDVEAEFTGPNLGRIGDELLGHTKNDWASIKMENVGLRFEDRLEGASNFSPWREHIALVLEEKGL